MHLMHLMHTIARVLAKGVDFSCRQVKRLQEAFSHDDIVVTSNLVADNQRWEISVVNWLL